MDHVDAVVVGAGVIGLAVGRSLALRGLDTVVLERAASSGSGISSRSSEVVHAGIYNPPDWLKSRLCVAGRERLYAYCESHGVAHARCGKLVVASSAAQEGALAAIAAHAEANGVALDWLDATAVRALEPALAASAALHSPRTGIVDSHALMLALLGDLERAGGVLALRAPLVGAEAGPGGLVVRIGGRAECSLATRFLVNAGGLGAAAVAGAIGALDPVHAPCLRYAKGSYFALRTRSPVSRLVYPIPEPGGLGVHATLDLAGRVRFGPDVEWLDAAAPTAIDYAVDPRRAARFAAAIRAWWPALPDDALEPAYSGVRPKLHGPDEAPRDFLLQGEQAHGVRGLLNLYGIESPGLTACLALADEVAGRLV